MATQPKHAANAPMERGQTLKKQRPSSASPLGEEWGSVLKGQKAEVISGVGRNYDRIPRNHRLIRSSERTNTNCEDRRLSRARLNHNTNELYVTTGSYETDELSRSDPAERKAHNRTWNTQEHLYVDGLLALGRICIAEQEALRVRLALRKALVAEEGAPWFAREAEEEAARLARWWEEAARLSRCQWREEGEQEAASLEAQEREEATFTAQHKVHGSMLVTYSAGLELRCVVSGLNSCRLTIRNLPANAKSDEIAEIFTQRGMSRDDFHILSVTAVNTDRLEAQVITKAEKGRAFAVGLDKIRFRNEPLPFDISENTSITFMAESSPEGGSLEGGNFLQYIPPSHLRPLHIVSETNIRDNICPICCDIVVRPVKLGCQHSYCTVCIQHYFASAARARIFPFVCMGNEAKCKVPIAIPIIQRFLSNQEYEQLLDVAFSTYMNQHPQDFRYCPTPNCMQIYRVDTKATMICPSCFAEVCTSCHEAHEGLSCEERRTRKAQEEERHNELWAAMHGVKRCPSCQVWIEKTEGCNHLACHCGAHICWICVKAFPVNKVYKHLGDVHGGAYNGDQNNDRQQALALRRQLDGPDDPVRGPGCGCIIM